MGVVSSIQLHYLFEAFFFLCSFTVGCEIRQGIKTLTSAKAQLQCTKACMQIPKRLFSLIYVPSCFFVCLICRVYIISFYMQIKALETENHQLSLKLEVALAKLEAVCQLTLLS